MNKLGERDQEAEFTCVQFPGLKQGMNALSFGRGRAWQKSDCLVALEPGLCSGLVYPHCKCVLPAAGPARSEL